MFKKINFKKLSALFVPASFALAVFLLFSNYDEETKVLNSEPHPVEVTDDKVEEKLEEVQTVEESYPHVMERGVALYTYLRELNVPSLDIIQMAKAAKEVKNLSSLQPGIRFQVSQNTSDELEEIRFRLSAVEELVVSKDEGEWEASSFRELVDIKKVSFIGKVDTTLWESAMDADMDPYLVVAMAEIFGWEVDFSREVRVGDAWRLTAEEKFVKGEHVGWGSVVAAEYINAGESHEAVLFRQDDEDMGYFTLEGENLRKMFLKSPLRFGRVTSHFNRRRFHPKLKVVRPHYGVDYGAPIGTPVRSVADGVVTFSRYSGGGGNILKIRHNSKYKTAYKHLSRYAKGIRPGVSVKQGQVVAYVGNTGLSTGPHLHYEFYINGRFVDPLKQEFPSADPIPQKKMNSFLKQARTRIKTLPLWEPKNFITLAQESWGEHLTPETQEYFCLKYEPDYTFKDFL